MKLTLEEAKKLLIAAEVFFTAEDMDEDPETFNRYILNMNDTWAWACAEAEDVPEEELPELGRLFWQYGWCGILYWVSQKNGGMRSEFFDNNRFIEFVIQEEKILKEVPNSSERAYKQVTYEIKGSRKPNGR